MGDVATLAREQPAGGRDAARAKDAGGSASAEHPLQACMDAGCERKGTAEQRDLLDRSPRVAVQARLADSLSRGAEARTSSTGAGRPAPGAGNGLPDGLRAGLESLSGVSLGHVRVHYNSARPAQLRALAYTQGSDIHVGPGQEAHLPHEGWHAAQQVRGEVQPTVQAKDLSINDDPRLEHEADVMGARAARLGAAGAPPDPGPSPRPAGPARSGAPVQGVWAEVLGERVRQNLRTERGRNGTVYVRSSDGQRFERVSGSARQGTLVVRPTQRGNVRARWQPDPIGRSRDATLSIRKTLRHQQVAESRQRVSLGFENLDPIRQEQVLGLARYLSQMAAALFENGLAEWLRASDEGGYDNAERALAGQRRDVPESSVSRRDQSKAFALDVSSTHKLFGGSIGNVRPTPRVPAVLAEDAFESGDLRPESLYAESARSSRDRVVSGLDTRVHPVLTDIDEPLRAGSAWLLFAVLHHETGASLFEVLASSGGLLGAAEPGVGVYRAVPRDWLPQFGWSVSPDWFEGPEFLGWLSRALYGPDIPAAPGETVPEAMAELVTARVEALKAAGAVQTDDSGGQVPRALWDEVPADERQAIAGVGDKHAYVALKDRYADESNPAAYIALVLQRGAEFGDRASAWHRSLAQSLLAPRARTEDLDAPQVSRQTRVTLGSNVSDVAAFLGDYDYGTPVGDRKDEAEELLRSDPGGASAVNRYIAGGFGSASDTLDRPWEKERNQNALLSIQGATRGLEGLPVRAGWSYRREDGQSDHQPGEIISPGVLWSSATAPQFASQFAPDGRGTLYAIESRYTGRDVQLLAGRLKWYQREVLFPPYARFVVEDKREDARYGIVYVLRELPPQGTSLEVADALGRIASQGFDEEREARTLIDARHWDAAAPKYARREAWTTQEAEQAGIEGLSAGIHDPRALYGLETLRRWRTLLRGQPTPEELGRLFSLDGFLESAEHVAGKRQELRDHPSGWGADNQTYDLGADQADNAVALGLRAGHTFQRADLTRNWRRNLKSLPRGRYRARSYAQVNSDAWIREFAKEIKQEGSVWVWRDDVAALIQAGVLKADVEQGRQGYEVWYGLSRRADIERELQVALGGARDTLAGLDRDDPDYARDVTHVAAALQQRIVAIHPFDDGNGRVSRLYMYKILQVFLPGDGGLQRLPVIPDTGADLTTSSADWQAQLWGLVSP